MTVQHIIQQVTKELADIPGIVGIVLGGSRARGTSHEHSDIDIGIYYDESAGFDLQQVNIAATRLDDQHREKLVAAPGEWGAWVNGGAWLIVQGYHVDLLFRDIHRVKKVMEDCRSGNVSSHYHTGHPHAYLNVMYMGEVAACRILSDPDGEIARLKAQTLPYPKPLKDAITGFFMFEASFSHRFAEKNMDKDDLSYVAGHCFRSISCLNQVLFALNEEYCINEKKAVRMIDGFANRPADYKRRVDHLFSLLSTNPENTGQAIKLLEDLVGETGALLGEVQN
ncbi:MULTISPECIES: nucleotidyltransferase domain-containing protein [unclassified Paenibacillus]|uniref:nucleotidyltransferase domain-containing protein n=1 Tax=unclassified Paenibacillus TaxID=185978 RepID=UPI000BA58EC7|nr:nucleotidyltransferase domain-containing protein [Paenibacillus sp. 7541]PAK49648.1 DNA polymerase subunit beta [Paenibacillus sp. 7541]